MNRIARAEAFLKAKLAENPDAAIHPERMAYRLEHSMRVANIGREIARAEGLAEEALVIACLLHDISYGEPWEGEQAWKEH
ncbi:MAG: HD domain-containing protein, partial [Candidatus Aphodomorpha sp.]